MRLDATQRSALIAIGYESIERGLRRGQFAPWPGPPSVAGLEVPAATFTTLHCDGELRGCCGALEARRPLAEDVWCHAWLSAFADSRFLPLAQHEFAALELQVSVLGPLVPLAAASERELLAALRPNEDGLVIQAGASRATFLPAVWEQLPDPVEFLRHLKIKAGWTAGDWPAGVRAFRYTTECFGAASRCAA
ncbi:MAG: AmmeMemoRadiSam system protein A [Steroidobacteraceae bacterium]